jgi:hypothetical protein
MTVSPTDSPIAAARARADAELKKAFSGLDPNDFSSSVPAFFAFIDSTKLLFNEKAPELLRTSTNFATFKRDLLGLRDRIVDEYTKAPPKLKMTRRQRRRLDRPIELDERLSNPPTDKWDLFAPTGLLPNKKDDVRQELRRVLGEQLSYWLREAAAEFERQRTSVDYRSLPGATLKPGGREAGKMAKSEFWRDIEARFRAIQSRKVPVHGVPWHDDSLYAVWLASGWSDTGDPWRLDGADHTVKVNFEWLAERAAVELGHPGGRSAVVFWLDLLKRDSPNYKGTGRIGDNGLTSAAHGKIDRVCEASADYCVRLETQDRIRGASEVQPLITKNDRTLTEAQQRRITDAEQELKDNLGAHEMMREVLEPGEWRRAGTSSEARTMVGEIPKLQRDIEDCVIRILRVLAEASWSIGSVELFGAQLLIDASDLLKWALAKVNPNDLVLLDKLAVQTALAQEVSTWIRKAQREFPPPGIDAAPSGVAPGLMEPQGSGFQQRNQLHVLDPFQQDAAARPLGENPFPPEHPAHNVFEEATWEAKQEIGQLQSSFLAPYETPAELLEAIFKYRTGHFNTIAKQGICVVGNDETARRYESWIDDSAKFYFEDTLTRINCKDPEADPAAPPFFKPESLASFKRDLTLELMRIANHYKTEAAALALRIKRDSVKNATEESNGPQDSSERRFKKTGGVWSLQYDGTPVSLPARIGMAYLEHLLRSPDRSFSCMDLQAAVSGNPGDRAVLDKQDEVVLPVGSSIGDEILDPTARKEYKERLGSIEGELQEAEKNNDIGRVEALKHEKEMLSEELKDAMGLAGRPRRFATDAEKARKAVAGAIRTALAVIKKHHPKLAQHLNDRIDRGARCCYRGDGIGWEV